MNVPEAGDNYCTRRMHTSHQSVLSSLSTIIRPSHWPCQLTRPLLSTTNHPKTCDFALMIHLTAIANRKANWTQSANSLTINGTFTMLSLLILHANYLPPEVLPVIPAFSHSHRTSMPRPPCSAGCRETEVHPWAGFIDPLRCQKHSHSRDLNTKGGNCNFCKAQISF